MTKRIPPLSGFVPDKRSIENNQGLLGNCSAVVLVGDSEFRIDASLASKEPDSSNDKRRAACQLTLTLTEDYKALLTAPFTVSYTYHGDTPGDELYALFKDDTLSDLLTATLSKGKAVLLEGYALSVG